MSLLSHVTLGDDPQPLLDALRAEGLLQDAVAYERRLPDLVHACKVLVNDTWEGVTSDPAALAERVRALRRSGGCPSETSVAWDVFGGELRICTDEGRCCRPLCGTDLCHMSGMQKNSGLNRDHHHQEHDRNHEHCLGAHFARFVARISRGRGNSLCHEPAP